MQITLSFNSQADLDDWLKGVREGSKALESLEVNEGAGLLTHTSRRKFFSEHELDIIKTYYQSKKITWIARYLNRKPYSIYQQLTKMYKAGLPKKRNHSGEVTEE